MKDVPLNIDGSIIYKIIQHNILSLDNCKGALPWSKVQSSKSKEFEVLGYYLIQIVTFVNLV